MRSQSMPWCGIILKSIISHIWSDLINTDRGGLLGNAQMQIPCRAESLYIIGEDAFCGFLVTARTSDLLVEIILQIPEIACSASVMQ